MTLKPGEIELAVQLIEQLAANDFDPTKYEDEYRKQGARADRAEGRRPGDHRRRRRSAPKGQIIDLMEALKASLAREERRAGEGGRERAAGVGRRAPRVRPPPAPSARARAK